MGVGERERDCASTQQRGWLVSFQRSPFCHYSGSCTADR